MLKPIIVYDENMDKVAYLDKAYNIGYEKKLNQLWYAHFTLASDDPKVAHCQPFYYVEFFDEASRVELFRILPNELKEDEDEEISYHCESVLATLMDDVMFKYHQVGNLGISTAQSIRYVLSQQVTKRWQLESCDYTRYFEYKWENENLLAALFSIAKPLDDYRWEINTKSYPWRISLKKLSKEPTSEIRYRKNLEGIIRTEDPTNIVTRLYGLGYGEGDNQLTIESVNGGIPYLEKNTTTYGIKQSILVDRRYENPEILKAYMQKMIDELSVPYVSYEISSIDLFRYDKNKYNEFIVGDVVKIINKDDNIVEHLPIISITKDNVEANGAGISIEVGNKPKDIAGSISDLQERQRINEVYGQGATNQMIIPFVDNADPANPATMRVYIPSEVIKINKCILNVNASQFRGYSKAIKGGGAESDTTEHGGADYISTESGGGTYTSTEYNGGSYTSTESGGGDYTSTDSGGGVYTSTGTERIFAETTWGGVDVEYVYNNTEEAEGHRHQIRMVHGHRHEFWLPYHKHTIQIPDHKHSLRLPNHWHDVYIPSHDHDVTIPNHAHGVRIASHFHRFSIPNHTHGIEFGIYQGSQAGAASIIVDGKSVGSIQFGNDIDLVPYLSVDGGGRIKRDHWHEIKIKPNILTRVEANVFLQTFSNSRGGGDY